jgi:BASS family bile acid:Na+ symporter
MILAVLIDAAPPDLSLFIAVGQFPIYMLPALAVPIYRRLLAPR